MKQLSILCFLQLVLLLLCNESWNAYSESGSHWDDTPSITIKNDITTPQTVFFQEDYLACKYGKVFSLQPDDSVYLPYSRFGFKKVGVSGWKEKVKVEDTYYFVSQLLLEASTSNDITEVRWKEPRTMQINNETDQEKRLTFTFFRDGRYKITILLHPRETLDVPYKKWSLRKRICLEGHKETTVEIEDRETLKIHDASIEVIRNNTYIDQEEE